MHHCILLRVSDPDSDQITGSKPPIKFIAIEMYFKMLIKILIKVEIKTFRQIPTFLTIHSCQGMVAQYMLRT